MLRQFMLRVAILSAVAIGGAFPADAARADLISNYGYVFTSISYDPDLAAPRGITMYDSLIWYSRDSSTRTGDATNQTESGYYYWLGPTIAQTYASALGTANAGSGVAFSSQTSSATAANYLWLYNSNDFDVMLPIRSYHYNYAWANSEALYSGSSYVIAQNFVDVYNYEASVSYNVENYYAWARSAGNYGVAGPAISEEEFFYDVRLTPGNNYIVTRSTVDTDGSVSVPSPVPEPGTLTLAAFGLSGFAGMAFHRRRVPVRVAAVLIPGGRVRG